MENYNKELEKNLLELVKEKEESDRNLLRLEIVLGVCCLLPLLAAVIVVSAVPMAEWIGAVVVLGSLLPLLIATPFALKIEQKAGYYLCRHCGHRHIPKYSSVFFAMHTGRTRYMRCPACGKYSWQKKILRKED